MPIRNEEDVMSRAIMQEKEWFQKIDRMQIDLDRWLYMPKGERGSRTWEMRKRLVDIKDLDDIDFVLSDPRHINRPDAISFKFYGNAKYWWIIAERNDITDPFTGFYKGRKLKIPSMEAVRKELGI
jgi:hypothetical protein